MRATATCSFKARRLSGRWELRLIVEALGIDVLGRFAGRLPRFASVVGATSRFQVVEDRLPGQGLGSQMVGQEVGNGVLVAEAFSVAFAEHFDVQRRAAQTEIC